MSTLVWHAISGRSMWPLGAPLVAGVAPVARESLQPGDVVAFLADYAPVLWMHRVARVTEDGLVTRGDTNDHDDPLVPFSAVLGRVEALRWGAITWKVPPTGWRARVWRQTGLAWSRVAPPARATFRHFILRRNRA